MAYNAGAFMRDYKPEYIDSIRCIRKRECLSGRDEKARNIMKQLNQERILKCSPSPRYPVLVCRRMPHLPNPYPYTY